MERSFKIVVAGDTRVGKTTWVHRLLTEDFMNDHAPTLGVDVHPLRVRTTRGEIVFNLWDCAGVEEFGGLRDGYYIMANGAVVMCDLTRRSTCVSARNWLRDISRVCENIPTVVCGNKIDSGGRSISLEEGTRDGIDYCEMSVSSAHNLRTPLLLLARRLLDDEGLDFVV